MLEMVFLGTGSMIPTEKRNHVATFIRYKNENILIDCGEGTQRQFRFAKINPTKITKILITHWHGDHILGLPGLLQTLEKNNYQGVLEIYGPKGTKKYFKNMKTWFVWNLKIKYKIIEISGKVFLKNKDFRLEAVKLKHNIPCLGYAFIERERRRVNINYLNQFGLKNDPVIKKLVQGKNIKWKGTEIRSSKATYLKKGLKICFISDTKYSSNIITFAKNSDLLVCEATFDDKFREKAAKFLHLTSKQSAMIAKKANVKKLVLTHFSQRYKDVSLILSEAKEIFANTTAASDFMTLKI